MRVPLTVSAVSPLLERRTGNASYLSSGINIRVFDRGADAHTDTPVNVYSAEVGGVVVAQPLVTDKAGRIEGAGGEECWVAEAPLDLEVAGDKDELVPWEPGRRTVVESDDVLPDGTEGASKIVKRLGAHADRDHWYLTDKAGVNGNGDDETAEIKEFLQEARAQGKPVRGAKGVHGVSASITDPADTSSSFRLHLEHGCVLERDFFAAAIATIAGKVTEVSGFAAGAPKYAEYIDLDTADGLEKGMYLHLKDPTYGLEEEEDEEAVEGGSGRVVCALAGEQVRVREVQLGAGVGGSDRVFIYGTLLWVYDETSTARVLEGPEEVYIGGGGEIRNAVPGTATSSAARGFLISRCERVRLENLYSRFMDAPSFYFVQNADVVCKSLYGKDMQEYENVPSRVPYLIAAGPGTQHMLIEGCTADYGRHLFTTLSDAKEIPPQQIFLKNCLATHMKETAYDTHPGARWVRMQGCDAHHCRSSAWKFRGPDMQLVGSECLGGEEGLRLYGGADRAEVRGNHIEAVTGIRIDNSDDWKITQNEIRATLAGVRVEKPKATWPGHMVRGLIDDNDFEGNPSEGAMKFVTFSWAAGFRIGSRNRIPDATIKLAGMTLPTTSPNEAGELVLPL